MLGFLLYSENWPNYPVITSQPIETNSCCRTLPQTWTFLRQTSRLLWNCSSYFCFIYSWFQLCSGFHHAVDDKSWHMTSLPSFKKTLMTLLCILLWITHKLIHFIYFIALHKVYHLCKLYWSHKVLIGVFFIWNTRRKQYTNMITDPNVWNTREKERWNRKETEVGPSQIIIF